MARTNGKTEMNPQALDLEHELPASDDTEDVTLEEAAQASAGAVESASEVQKLRAERDMLMDRLARLQAEFENARKRAAREQQDYRDYAVADAVKLLLPILDSFERALETTSTKTGEFRNGVELIYKQVQDALAKLGVQPVAARGQPFDPHVHQAIEMVETDEVPDHQVVDELQRGYKLKERLLRPAMVRVAKNSR
jgi:molecular chaperone GrpE